LKKLILLGIIFVLTSVDANAFAPIMEEFAINMKERPCKIPGPKKGSAYVTEYNPKTGQVRSWGESYDKTGNENRVHPKMLNGQDLKGQHYLPTGKEKESWSPK
jgi:hypothetical protein